MAVDVVVCVDNEADRIEPVLLAIMGSSHASNLVVVCDACTDGTDEIAAGYATALVRGDWHDKGSAMAAGVAAVRSELVAFVDADLRGLTATEVDRLLTVPPLAGQLVGLRSGYPRIFGALPSLSGERRLPTWLARSVKLLGSGWKAEILLNAAVAEAGLPWSHIVLDGVDNLAKFKAADHPLAWLGEQLQILDALVTYSPELVRYTLNPGGRQV